MQKEVTFSLRGSARYQQAEMARRLVTIVDETYPDQLRPRQTDELFHRVGMVDLGMYYTKHGPKVTKPVSTIVKEILDKKVVEENFAMFCKRVADLYEPVTELTATFAPFSEMGQGIWEGRGTCTGEGGAASSTRVFLEAYKRARMLVLYRGKKPESTAEKRNVARAVMYLPGGRHVFLTNMYYSGLPQNPLIFVEAVRRMFNLPKVSWRRSEEVFLPIYRNGDCVHIFTERSTDYSNKKRTVNCPHCKKRIQESKLVMLDGPNGKMIGCTERCAKIASGYIFTCPACGKEGDKTSAHGVHDIARRASGSHTTVYYHAKSSCKTHDSIARCGGCPSLWTSRSMVSVKGDEGQVMSFCPNCVRRGHVQMCGICEEYVYPNACVPSWEHSLCGESKYTREFHKTHGVPVMFCMKCVTERRMRCSRCKMAFEQPLSNVRKKSQGGVGRNLCPNCFGAEVGNLDMSELNQWTVSLDGDDRMTVEELKGEVIKMASDETRTAFHNALRFMRAERERIG